MTGRQKHTHTHREREGGRSRETASALHGECACHANIQGTVPLRVSILNTAQCDISLFALEPRSGASSGGTSICNLRPLHVVKGVGITGRVPYRIWILYYDISYNIVKRCTISDFNLSGIIGMIPQR